jgi:hypothetical protein
MLGRLLVRVSCAKAKEGVLGKLTCEKELELLERRGKASL